MSGRSARHATFTVERTFAAAPARVFAAHADAASRARWFGGPGGGKASGFRLDFRIGGRESARGGPPGGPAYRYEAIYQDIVTDRRIVLTYEMHRDGTRLSASLGTTEFRPSGGGTRLVYTEQAVFLDGHDDARGREQAMRLRLGSLAAMLEAH